MDIELEKFFERDDEAFYINENGARKFRGVHRYYNDTVRNEKADEQAELFPVSFSKVFSCVNEFLERIRFDNGYKKKIVRCEYIELDNIQQVVLDNGIIAKDCNWGSCEYDKKQKKYTDWDAKYNVICDRFQLKQPYDIVWLKFTTKGHLGVVAKGFDINYDYTNSSGVLINQVDENWDTTFVLIFPLTSEILGNHTSGDIELAIGKYLISKKVPIIDYYSHNN